MLKRPAWRNWEQDGHRCPLPAAFKVGSLVESRSCLMVWDFRAKAGVGWGIV